MKKSTMQVSSKDVTAAILIALDNDDELFLTGILGRETDGWNGDEHEVTLAGDNTNELEIVIRADGDTAKFRVIVTKIA